MPGNVKIWTTEEDQFLKRNSEKMTVSEFMKTINASWIQIHHRCKKLGVKPIPVIKKRKNLTEAEKILCLEHPCKAPKILGIHPQTVRKIRRQILGKQILFNDRTPIPVPVAKKPEIEKTDCDIENILAQFPELLPSQRQQAINIAQYDAASAWRYCEAIRQFKVKYPGQERNPHQQHF